MSDLPPSYMEVVRLRMIDRMAALLESQNRSKRFGENLRQLIHQTHAEVFQELQQAGAAQAPEVLSATLHRVADMCSRLDQSMDLLFDERQRQWHKNGNYVQALLGEFNETLTDLSTTLVEKDLFERQSRVLERIILSHENVTHWKIFVQTILADFHAIFPFNFFYIVFTEEHGLSLFLYYLGDYPAEVRKMARQGMITRLLEQLGMAPDMPLDIEEFVINRGASIKAEQIRNVQLFTMAVPELEKDSIGRLAGLLGVAYATTDKLLAQEESIIRSILAVMVMVVGSSRALSRTLAELEHYSMHDPLTGLYNRRHFNTTLEDEVGRSERHRHEFSVLFLDLDDFKDINDTYGHQAGDSVLRGVAEILHRQIRVGDVPTRIGGDEFAVILMETGRDGATRVANAIGRELRERVFTTQLGKSFQLTASIGVVTYPHDAQNAGELMASVDIAMYRAKQMGKDSTYAVDALDGGYVLATRTARDYAEKLRGALHENRIVPYYHSIIDCQSGEVFAMEALARLIEPDGALIGAGMFVETLEKYGLGRELDRVIISNAFAAKQEKLVNGQAMTKLFINLSAQEIQGRGILAYAEELCNRLGIPPSCIVFEVLERDAIGDMSHMRGFLDNLREKGFAFALDDFGSGYNSFHYLRELHFEYVKIDGEFVRNILNSKVDYALVKNLSQLCQDIGTLTVAEFVEDQGILDAVREMGINYAQGFHISMPTRDMRF